MKPADSAAGNGNEGKGKDLSREDRAGAIDEAGERRHLKRPGRRQQIPTASSAIVPV